MAIKEHQIEINFIKILNELKYIYRPDIKDRDRLELNFRQKFEELNRVNLSDNEFNRLLDQIITNDVFRSSQILREKNSFIRDDGTPLYFTLVNIKNWCKNSFEVINQLKINTRNSYHRYDVIILINGLPLVQIELKTLEVSPKRAMEQIINYKNDVGNGYTNTLLSFMQLFIVSNQTNTYYFANNKNNHFNFNANEDFLPIYQYADKKNRKITNLTDFAKAFLSKCKLAKTISSYMVLVQSEQKILIMRPYQIYAVEAIIECIEQNRGNGYIWHTTGSGKTLTSFKASTILKENDKIYKCLFVVDRKDLDRQTREEFNKFQDGCVEENTNTKKLVDRLLSTNYEDKIIVTTIQKLSLALSHEEYKELLSPLQNKKIVFIFDECHRSQFGKNHQAIKEFFPNHQLFGFTGTPIFEQNATYKQIDGEIATLKTTKDIFSKELHSYTITNAIDDKNVLKFLVNFYETDKMTEKSSKKAIVKTIINKHFQATNEQKFNAIFATSSINDAIEYYELFKAEIHNLNIVCLFSPPANGNKDIKQLQEDLPQESIDNKIDPDKKSKALQSIIDDYNQKYGTNFNITEFDKYYQDLTQRIKNQKYSNSDYPHSKKIDIVIVVDMLLTGFDSKYLNTLYVDKNLKHHGLIQSFSRTNRVLNNSKPYGNILDFKGLSSQVDEAITLFSGENKEKSKEIWLVKSADDMIDEFKEATNRLKILMNSFGLESTPSDVLNLKGDEAKAGFINSFKEIQRLKTTLNQYTNLSDTQKEIIEKIMPNDTIRAFRGVYLDIAKELQQKRQNQEEKSEILEQLDFEFVLFLSAMIDYDYIMKLISRYSFESKKQKVTKEQLINILKSNSNFLDESEELAEFIESLEIGIGLNEDEIKEAYEEFKKTKLHNELLKISHEFNLEPEKLEEFINITINRLIFDSELLDELLKPLKLNWKGKKEIIKKLMTKLIPLLKKLAKGRDISGLEVYDV